MTVLRSARVVTPEGVINDGWVQVREGVISAVGAGQPPQGSGVDLGGSWLLPGYIDLHVHGGGGHDASASPADLAEAVAFHRRHGTTRTLVSLVAAPPEDLARQLGWIADLVAVGPTPQGHVIGAHLEGPFLSPARCGAQNPAHLLLPDTAVLSYLVEAARGTLRCMTIAPELPGALGAIAAARAAGVVVAVGHTDAVYKEARAGLDAGVRLATHLFNGMPPLHHREPGAVGAVLEGHIAFEIINDGIHIHPLLVRLVAQASRQLVLVTDAISAAGTGDGEFSIGGQRAYAREGSARLVGTGALAGSVLTMDAAVRYSVIECGVPIEVAAAAASANPARVLGIGDRCGTIAAGQDADLVVLGDDLRLVRVMAGGTWCDE